MGIIFIKIFRTFNKNRGLQVLGVILALLETTAFLVMPFMFKIFIDGALVDKDVSLMYKSLGGYFSIVMIAVVFGAMKSVIFKLLDERNIKDARMFLVRAIRGSRLSKVDSYKTGTLMSYLLNDSKSMLESLSSVLGTSLQNIIRIVAGVIILGIIDLKILLVVICFLPLYLLDVLFFNKPLKETSAQLQKQNQIITEKLQEHLMGSNEIIINNKRDWEEKRFMHIFDGYIKTAVRSIFWGETSFGVGFLIYWFVLILIYLLSGGAIIRGTMTIGTMLLYANYVDNIYMPCKVLLQQNINIQRCIASGERYFELTESLKEDSAESQDMNLAELEEGFIFRNVSFGYDNEMILKGIDIEIKKGEFVALVGESGSGKSTMMKLLLNLYEPTDGEILLDGKNISGYKRNDLYSMISVFFQDVFLFHGTLEENLTFVNEDAIHEDILRCIRWANVDELLNDGEEPRDVQIEEHGRNLSGGQRQRVAVARTLLKDSEVFIFDEPTSALDGENKDIIFRAIRRLKEEGKTVIMITHDLNNIHMVDRVFEFIDGGVVEKVLKK